ATVVPNVWRTLANDNALFAASGAGSLDMDGEEPDVRGDAARLWQLHVDRHAWLEHAGRVVDGHLDAVDQPSAFVAGLHVPRRELGARRDERNAAREMVAPVGHDGQRLSNPHC